MEGLVGAPHLQHAAEPFGPDLLYGSGNPTGRSVVNYMVRKSDNGGRYVYVIGASLVTQWYRICLRCRFDSWVRKTWRRAWPLTAVFLP